MNSHGAIFCQVATGMRNTSAPTMIDTPMNSAWRTTK